MKWLSALSSLANLINRLLDKVDEHDKQRKQIRREDRRASVAEKPDEAFAKLFGQPDSGRVRESSTEQNQPNVLTDTTATKLDKNQ